MSVLTEIEIRCPREQVAAFAGDPMNAPKWNENIKSVRCIDGPGVRPGARAEFVAEFQGRRLAYTYEIVEYDPGHYLVMMTSEGPFPMSTTYTWADAGPGRTKMTLSNWGRPCGFSRVFAPLMARSMRKANRKDLDNLKRILESRDRT